MNFKTHQVTLLRKQISRFILPTKYQLMILKLRHWSASTSVYFFGHFRNFRCIKSSTERHSKWCNLSSFLSTIKSGDKIWVLLSSSGRFTQHLFAINSDLNVNSYSFFVRTYIRLRSNKCILLHVPQRVPRQTIIHKSMEKGIYCRTFEFETRFHSYAWITPEDYNGKAKLETIRFRADGNV